MPSRPSSSRHSSRAPPPSCAAAAHGVINSGTAGLGALSPLDTPPGRAVAASPSRPLDTSPSRPLDTSPSRPLTATRSKAELLHAAEMLTVLLGLGVR